MIQVWTATKLNSPFLNRNESSFPLSPPPTPDLAQSVRRRMARLAFPTKYIFTPTTLNFTLGAIAYIGRLLAITACLCFSCKHQKHNFYIFKPVLKHFSRIGSQMYIEHPRFSFSLTL